MLEFDTGECEGRIEAIDESVFAIERITVALLRPSQCRDADLAAKGMEPPAAVGARVPSSRTRTLLAPRALQVKN